ncbi:MAG: glucose-1-phosphate adenylyltransferase family protein [Lachnospiraceae bacterium]
MKKTIGLISANYAIEEINPKIQERGLAALPFGGRYRLIDFPLSNLKNSGVSCVGIITPFNSRSLIDHIGAGKAWGFGRKANNLFMLPGSVYGRKNDADRFLLRDIILNFRFIDYDNADYVILCGVNKIFNMNFQPMIKQHEQSGNDLTVAYTVKDGKDIPLDCVIINRSFLIDIVSWFGNLDFFGLRTIIENYHGDASIGRYDFDGEVIIIENMHDYLKGNLSLLDNDIRAALFNPDNQIYTNVQDRAPTFYGPSSKVKNSLIAAGCMIEGEVENSVIFRSSYIRKGAKVKNSVLMQDCNVSEGAYLNNFICDKRVHVMENVRVEGTMETPYYVQKGQIV